MIGAAAILATVGVIAGEYGLQIVGIAAAGLAGVLWLLHEVLVRK